MKFNSIFTYFIIIIFSPLIGKIIKTLTLYYKSYKQYKINNTLLQLVYRLTPREFEIWCGDYLSHLNFTNIVLLPLGPDGGKDIICNNKNEKYYIECKRYASNKLITTIEVEKLLGTMIADKINNGIIITTGGISEDANSFLKNLKKPYNISILSSSELNCSYSEYILQSN